MKLIYLAPAAFALAACASAPDAARASERAEVTCRYDVDQSVGGQYRKVCRTAGEWAYVDTEQTARRENHLSSLIRGTNGVY